MVEHSADIAARNGYSSVVPRDPAAFLVRRALWRSLLAVLASSAIGYGSGWIVHSLFECLSRAVITGMQLGGAALLLWGALFLRGWEIQTYAGVTIVERVNRWLFVGMCCLGTGLLVASLPLSACLTGSSGTGGLSEQSSSALPDSLVRAISVSGEAIGNEFDAALYNGTNWTITELELEVVAETTVVCDSTTDPLAELAAAFGTCYAPAWHRRFREYVHLRPLASAEHSFPLGTSSWVARTAVSIVAARGRVDRP